MILPGCWQAMHPPLSSSQSPLGSISAWRRKLRPLPCSSSPHRNRSAGFLRGPRLTRQKENGRWSRPREKTLARNLRRAQVRLNAGAILTNCHQFPSLLPARAVLVPQIGFPRAYTPAVNVGGHRKACPPGPANATLALPGSTSGKRRRPVLFLESAFPACTLRRSSLVVVGKPVLLAPLAL